MDGNVAAGPIVMLMIMGVMMLLTLVSLVFWVWIIIDCAKNEPAEGNDKLIWMLVVILLGWIGGLIYYFARRPDRIQKYGH